MATDFNSKYSGEQVEQLLDQVKNGGTSSNSGSAYPYVDGNPDGAAILSEEILPNVFYDFGEVSILDLSLGDATSGVMNEYIFQFTSGSTATTLTLPNGIKWTEDVVIESDKIYQISIVNGLGVMMSWANAADLIDNKCVFDGSSLTFTYAVASDVTVYIGASISMAEAVVVSAGSTSVDVNVMLDPGSIILNIEPERDDVYNYIF